MILQRVNARSAFWPPCGLLFIGQMIQDVAPLMDLAALDRRRLTGVLLYRRVQRFATIQHIQCVAR